MQIVSQEILIFYLKTQIASQEIVIFQLKMQILSQVIRILWTNLPSSQEMLIQNEIYFFHDTMIVKQIESKTSQEMIFNQIFSSMKILSFLQKVSGTLWIHHLMMIRILQINQHLFLLYNLEKYLLFSSLDLIDRSLKKIMNNKNLREIFLILIQNFLFRSFTSDSSIYCNE